MLAYAGLDASSPGVDPITIAAIPVEEAKGDPLPHGP
jgi:hypothetical protein